MMGIAVMTANGHADFAPTGGLSTRAHNALKDAGFIDEDRIDVARLREISDAELLRIPNFGRKSLRELRETFGGQEQPSAEEARLVTMIERVISEALSRSTKDHREFHSFWRGEGGAIRNLLHEHQILLRQIAVSCNSMHGAMSSVMKKAALALSDFTDVDLLAELQRRSQVRQEEARQKPPETDPTKATIDAILKA
jgi:hypothetical protein